MLVLSLSFFFFFGGSGDQTQGITLAKQVLYLSHLSSPFYSGYFRDGSFQLCPDWPQTVILLILASQVTRITGMTQPPVGI
jgi:hypothetical protein